VPLIFSCSRRAAVKFRNQGSSAHRPAAILVKIVGDIAPESNETLTLNLSGAVGADIIDGVGVATIVNDD
jgi:hypothetical protein